eukprot:Gb_11885 [translate_table: standard]
MEPNVLVGSCGKSSQGFIIFMANNGASYP